MAIRSHQHPSARWSDTVADMAVSSLGSSLLIYLRERQEALGATPGRKIHNFASGAMILVIMGLAFSGFVPLWAFWIAFPASLVLDLVLTRRWVGEDALRAHRADTG